MTEKESIIPRDRLPGAFFAPSNLLELLEHRCDFQPDDVAFTFLIDGENQQAEMTYRELSCRAKAIAAWLNALGLAGQRALLLFPPGLDFIAAFFGCLYARVVAVPLYPPRLNRSLERIETIAHDADARVALTTESVLGRVRPLVAQTPGLKDLMWLATGSVPAAIEKRWERPAVGAETLAFLQYTSGSTGTPKGVMLSHGNLMHNSALIAHAFEHTRSGMGVFWLPSYHDMGLIGGILQPIFVGRPNVLMSPMAFLQKPYRWLAAITRFAARTTGGITSGGPNFAYDLCVRKITPEQRQTLDLSRWAVAFNGAEPVREETLEQFAATFAPCGFRRGAFYPCYGLAEATLIVSGGYVHATPKVEAIDADALRQGLVLPAGNDGQAARRLVGCGEVLPDTTVRIVDPETLTRCAPGQVGEIWVGGPGVAQGYWRQPKATAAIFAARVQDAPEGPLLRTGDLGFLRDGELFVTGRLKDVIIVRGVNHYPHDIERTIENSHAALRPGCGAVFTVARDRTEELVAVHEVERGTPQSHGAICAAVYRAVADEHDVLLNAILLLKPGSIPKTSSGKIQRHACRDAYLAESFAVVGAWREGEALDFASVTPLRAAALDASAEPLLADDRGDLPMVPRSGHLERPLPVAGNGKAADTGEAQSTTQCVLEEVRRVGKHRVAGVRLDTRIADLGLESLERMEIVAALEERLGGRLPEEVLPQLETCRQLVEAVDRYLGQPRSVEGVRTGDAEVPEAHYRIDQFPEIIALEREIAAVESTGVENPFFHVHEGVLSARTVIGGRDVLNFSTFNYLGMSGHPTIAAAAKAAIDRYGTSASASRLVSGERILHRELETAIARFLGTEDAITFVAGHSTNESVIGHLVGPGDLILHDALAHNSILQGALLSGARRRSFAHNDWQAADEVLRQYRRQYRRVLILIEGVYSMDGDIPNLPEFIAVKRKHKATLMIDEAHSIGVLGTRGRGLGELFDVDRADVEIWMGSLSKALGSCGGYVAGARSLVQYLKYTAPAFVFAAGIAPAACAAALAAIKLLEADPSRVRQLHQRAALFLSLAKRRGLNTGTSQDTPVVPVILGNSLHCLQASQAMLARGINVRPILYPAVEEHAARLRFFLHAEHTNEDLGRAIEVLAEELTKIDARYVAAADVQPASAKQPSSTAPLGRA